MTEGGVAVQKCPARHIEAVRNDHSTSSLGRAASATPPPTSSCIQNGDTLYSSVTTSVLTEFIPSRQTRPSSNRALQHQVADVHTAMKQRGLQPRRRTTVLESQSSGCETLGVHYADLDFMRDALDAGYLRSGETQRDAEERREKLASVYGLQRSAVYENLVAPRDAAQVSLWFGKDHSCIPLPASDKSTSEEAIDESVETLDEDDIPSSPNAGTEEETSTEAATSQALQDLEGACYSVPSKKPIYRTTSGESTYSDYDELSTGNASESRGDDYATSSRSNSLSYKKRVLSRKRCVTPLSSSPVPVAAKAPEARRRVYEETDLLTGLPLDISPPSCTVSPTPVFPWSPLSQDHPMCCATSGGVLHTRSSSAPDTVSPLSEEPPCNPLSPLAQELVAAESTTRMNGRPLPQPPQRKSSLLSKSRSSENIMTHPYGHRRQKSVDTTPPLPPKTRRRLNTTGATSAAASPCSFAAESSHRETSRPLAPLKPCVHGEDVNSSCRVDCASPSSYAGSACSSPELINIETMPSRSSWRQSSAQEIFGNFRLQFVGRGDVDSAYGAVNDAIERVLQDDTQDIYANTDCELNITASTLAVTGENDLVMHHEVDSVETIAPYTGDAVAASDGQRCLLAYVVVEEEVSAICYIFRASSETERNTILNTIESALYADVKKFKSMTYPRRVINGDSTGTHSGQFSVKHVGSIAVQSAYNSIDEAGRRLLSHTHPAKACFCFMDLDVDRIRLSKLKDNGIFASHRYHAITSVGSFSEDSRVFGYVVRQRTAQTHMCHVFRCSRPTNALAILECIKDACQESYAQKTKFKEVRDSSDDEKSSSGGIRGFFRKRSSRMNNDRKYTNDRQKGATADADLAGPNTATHIMQLDESPPMRRFPSPAENIAPVTSSPASAVFSLHYLGTGSLPQSLTPPKSMTNMIMQSFRNHGVEGGAVECGSVETSLRVSSQGVTVSYANTMKFKRQNFPRQSVFHVDQHEADRDLFSFATLPSASLKGNVGRAQMKVHVFRSTEKPATFVTGVLRGILEC